jgi:2,3-bisphosphoglycerate-dependent phosphoglycerate mutase
MLKNIFNISNKKITELEVPTGNPLLIKFENDLKVLEYMYLDKARSKKIFFNS